MKDVGMLFIGFGVFGVPYVVVVGFVYAVLLATWRRFKFDMSDAFALAAPIVTYLVMSGIVRDRQGFNAGYANLWIGAAVCAVLPVKVFGSRWPIVNSVIVALVGVIAANLSWRFVPGSGPMPLF
jgi:hypothetical protein